MNWTIISLFGIYAVIGVFTLLVWWLIYDTFLSRGHKLRDALFGQRPNPAVALDLTGGFLAAGLLLYSIVSMAPRTSFRLNIPAVVLSILVVVLLLALLRGLIAVFLRVWFGARRDAQGDIISLNNELFIQRNLATGVFSTVVYLVLVAGLVELDPWSAVEEGLPALWNMLGIWLFGIVVIVLHSALYLGYGTRNNILHESFHDNNPAAPCSLLGLMAGMLPLTHQVLLSFGPGQHMFSTWDLWGSLAVILVLVFLARTLLQVVIYLVAGINLRYELVIHDNVAWGLVDGGLILSLVLILMGLMV